MIKRYKNIEILEVVFENAIIKNTAKRRGRPSKIKTEETTLPETIIEDDDDYSFIDKNVKTLKIKQNNQIYVYKNNLLYHINENGEEVDFLISDDRRIKIGEINDSLFYLLEFIYLILRGGEEHSYFYNLNISKVSFKNKNSFENYLKFINKYNDKMFNILRDKSDEFKNKKIIKNRDSYEVFLSNNDFLAVSVLSKKHNVYNSDILDKIFEKEIE